MAGWKIIDKWSIYHCQVSLPEGNPSQTWHFLACQNAMPFVSSVEAVIYGHSMYIFGGWDGHDTLQAGVILALLSTGLRVDPKS